MVPISPPSRNLGSSCLLGLRPLPIPQCYAAPLQTTADIFLEFSRRELLEKHWPRLRACVEQLSDEQIWWRPNEASNSIGNLMLHLDGNVRQWLVVSFGKLADTRNRPAEFQARGGRPASALIEQLGASIEQTAEVLSRLTEDDLLTKFEIQGYNVTGLQAVYQVVEHFGMHYGQIVYMTKAFRGEDLGFYRELDKTGRAS
jgi:uncharacterized damage-inducible protein DinB